LTQESASKPALVHGRGGSVRILPAGNDLREAADLLASPRLPQLLTSLEQEADLILVEGPPVLQVADTRLLAAQLSGTILVLSTRTRSQSVIEAQAELSRAGASVVGVVLDEVDPSLMPFRHHRASGRARSTEQRTAAGPAAPAEHDALGVRSRH